jgi:hypothetical protein
MRVQTKSARSKAKAVGLDVPSSLPLSAEAAIE